MSGKYNFHSLYKNFPVYIRDGGNSQGKLPAVYGENFYFLYFPHIGKWYFQNDGNMCFLKTESASGIGGLFHLQTDGK